MTVSHKILKTFKFIALLHKDRKMFAVMTTTLHFQG